MSEINNTVTIKDNIVEAMQDRKAKSITTLDLRKLDQSIADYFIICHGESNIQVDAIADHIDKEIRTNLHEHVIHKEGLDNSQWVLLDYGSVVVHVFQEEYRGFYNLEDLWADAEKQEFKDE